MYLLPREYVSHFSASVRLLIKKKFAQQKTKDSIFKSFWLFCLCFREQKANTKTGEVSDTPVGMMDVYQEFNELSEKFKIMKFKSKVSKILSL